MKAERESLLSYINDAYKDAYGTRPGNQFNDLSLNDLRALADNLSQAVMETIERENQEKAEAVQEFQESVQTFISYGAEDEKTAIRWMIQDEEFENIQDVEQWVWQQGILFTDYGKQVVEILKEVTCQN